ncbi:MAG: hypothetical protein HYV63_13990 [Candidatus Schekmanbacteria bacterium]|nr:hypothetical protein [Candidatus Schekmanbacteria bacterium]
MRRCPSRTTLTKALTLFAAAAAAACAIAADNSAHAATDRWLIAFAANLAGDGGCHKEDVSGCDLYLASFDPAAQQAQELRRLTSTAGTGERFPSLSPDGCFVAYEAMTTSGTDAEHSVRLVHAPTLTDQAVAANAYFPDWSPDGLALAYAGAAPADQHVSRLDITADCAHGTYTAEATSTVTTADIGYRASDPDFFPDGERLSFNLNATPDDYSQVAVINADGSAPSDITAADGYGHSFVRGDGAAIGFGSSQLPGLFVSSWTGTGWTAAAPLMAAPQPAAYLSFDARFSECARVSTSYAAWVGDSGRQVLYSAQCYLSSTPLFSRLVIATIAADGAGVQLFDIGGAIEQLAGVTQRDFFTADILAVRAAATAVDAGFGNAAPDRHLPSDQHR